MACQSAYGFSWPSEPYSQKNIEFCELKYYRRIRFDSDSVFSLCVLRLSDLLSNQRFSFKTLKLLRACIIFLFFLICIWIWHFNCYCINKLNQYSVPKKYFLNKLFSWSEIVCKFSDQPHISCTSKQFSKQILTHQRRISITKLTLMHIADSTVGYFSQFSPVLAAFIWESGLMVYEIVHMAQSH